MRGVEGAAPYGVVRVCARLSTTSYQLHPPLPTFPYLLSRISYLLSSQGELPLRNDIIFGRPRRAAPMFRSLLCVDNAAQIHLVFVIGVEGGLLDGDGGQDDGLDVPIDQQVADLAIGGGAAGIAAGL